MKKFYTRESIVFKCAVMLLITLPIATVANAHYMLSTPETLVPVILGSILGALAATAIPTDVDISIKRPTLTKLVIGTAVGILCPLTWEAFDPSMTANKLALPAFVLALFGTPICCFGLTLICEPLTWKIVIYAVLRRFGFDVDLESLFEKLEEKKKLQQARKDGAIVNSAEKGE